MDEFCPRQIIFELPGDPPVQITATEHHGTIEFIVDVLDDGLSTADLRGLFFHFNEAKLAGLVVTDTSGGLITATQIAANSVIDLGQGANMSGAAAPFDIGIRWGTPGGAQDDIFHPVTFTLSNAAGDLTLDDFAHLEFGARLDSVGGPGGDADRRGGVSKITGIAPAAPDAVDDVFDIFEDGGADLNSPSKTPTAVSLNVLANDTDGDGDQLVITGFHDGPQHGTVTISADGQSVLYTPFLDFSGEDSFEYCVSDGNGGQDHALITIRVEAVADEPLITYQVAQGANINQILITVTATQDDADSSEFIDQIYWSAALPAGVTVTPAGENPGGEPDQVQRQFVIDTPAGQDINFNLDFHAVSQETSNGDQETQTLSVPIVIDFNHNFQTLTYVTENQDSWSSGDPFIFHEEPFLGINESFDYTAYFFIPPDPIPFEAEVEGHFKAGLQATIHFEAGDIDATVPLDVTIDTTYNKTTDAIWIDPSFALGAGGFFDTTGPEGFFKLEFLIDFLLHADVGLPFDIGPSIDETWSFADSYELFELSSNSPDLPYTVPILPGIVDIDFDWPHLQTTSTPGTLESEGASNNFLQLNLDVDALAAAIFPLLSFIDSNTLDDDNFEILDLDIFGGLNVVQHFLLNVLGFEETKLVLEDGFEVDFTFGTGIMLTGASDHDIDDDGSIDFTLALTPRADLTNQTGVGVNLGGSLVILNNTPLFGDVLSYGVSFPVAEIPVFDDTFPLLGWSSQNFEFFV